MPVLRIYLVACDSVGCREALQYGAGCDGARARRNARRLGWSIGKKVTCPSCIAKQKESSAA